MKFYPYRFGGNKLFFPAIQPNAAIPELPAGRYTAVELAGRRTRVLTNVLRMALVFNSTAESRLTTGQECTAFAFACATGDTLDGRDWYRRPGGCEVNIINRDFRPIEKVDLDAFANPGEIVFSGIPTADTNGRAKNAHVQVLATPPEEPPLYFFKWGVGSLVGVHALSTVIWGMYPATHVDIVEQISATRIPFTNPS